MSLNSATRTLGALAALLGTLPVDVAIVACALIRRPARPHASRAPRRRTVLITGGKMTKALTLARAFHLAGHRVVLVESPKYRFSGHRFSKAVDRFHCIPESTSPHYADALLDVVKREEVDVFVPVSSPASSVHDADAGELLAGFCEVVHGNSRTVRTVDDKARFSEISRSYGVRVPDSRRITDPQQIAEFDFPAGREYILKRIAYNPVGRMDLRKLSRETPEWNVEFAVSGHHRGRPVDSAAVCGGAGVLHTWNVALRTPAGLRVLRVIGLPGQLPDGHQTRDLFVGRGIRRATRRHGPVLV